MTNQPIAQIAYHTPDIEAAAQRWSTRVGAGPFFVLRNIELSACEHRGLPCNFVHSSAYGQWGKVMLELVCQESEGPSPLRDLFEPQQTGLHHTAIMVDDLEAAYQHFTNVDMPVVTRATTLTGTEFGFVDATIEQGHYIELYEKTEALTSFYKMIEQASTGWRGSNPIRFL